MGVDIEDGVDGHHSGDCPHEDGGMSGHKLELDDVLPIKLVKEEGDGVVVLPGKVDIDHHV